MIEQNIYRKELITMSDNNTNRGVRCRVSECHYHTTDDRCTAECVEISNCADCVCAEKDTFCSTYRQK